MLAFILRRLLLMVPVLFGLLLLTFCLMRVVPSDPAAMLAGENATAEQIAQIRLAYGFDRPLPEQFLHYLGQVIRGDFGESIMTRRPVMEDILSRVPATVELAGLAILMAVLLGVPLGLIAGANHNGWTDHIVRLFTVGGLAVASFWLAIMLQLALSMKLSILPLQGRIGSTMDAPPGYTGLFVIDYLLSGQPKAALIAFSHLILPAVTLALPAMATIARFTRSSVLEMLQKDFVAYETAVGLPRRMILTKYVLRNSLSATITQIGLLVGLLLSGSIIVEAVYVWPGLGQYAYSAIITSDYQPVLAVTLVIGVVYAVVNILVDLVQALIDPRIAEQL